MENPTIDEVRQLIIADNAGYVMVDFGTEENALMQSIVNDILVEREMEYERQQH
jgi:hypothetical protein